MCEQILSHYQVQKMYCSEFIVPIHSVTIQVCTTSSSSEKIRFMAQGRRTTRGEKKGERRGKAVETECLLLSKTERRQRLSHTL